MREARAGMGACLVGEFLAAVGIVHEAEDFGFEDVIIKFADRPEKRVRSAPLACEARKVIPAPEASW